MTFHDSQRRLFKLWMIGGGGIIFIVALQGLLGHYGDKWDDAGKWLMSTIFPNAGVIVGAIAFSAHSAPEESTVNPQAFRSAWWVSLLYLTIVSLVVFLQPIVADSTTPVELMGRANVILGPLQGLVGTALGVFFLSRRLPDPSEQSANIESAPVASELSTPAQSL